MAKSNLSWASQVNTDSKYSVTFTQLCPGLVPLHESCIASVLMFYPHWSVSAFSPLMLPPACVLGPDQLQWLYPQWPKRTAGCWCGNLPQPLPGQPRLLAQLHRCLQQWQVSGFLSFGAAGMHPNRQLSKLCHPQSQVPVPENLFILISFSSSEKKKKKIQTVFSC